MTLYSHSKIETYNSCPLKYRFNYIEKAKTQIKGTIEAFMGSRVHEALEKLYKDLQFERKNQLQDLIEFYQNQWDKEWQEGILVVREDYTVDDYRAMGVRFISEYYDRFAPFDQDKTIGVEEYILFDLDDQHQLQGYIDRLSYEGDGLYTIHDYKTSNSLKTAEDADNDRQLALYAIAIKKKYQDCKRVRLVWHMLAFDKDVIIEKTEEDLLKTLDETKANVKKIEAATEFPDNKTALCGWCEFQPICPHFKHLWEINRLLDNKYLSDEMASLVDSYMRTSEEKNKVEVELNKIKEAILIQAEKQNMLTVYSKDTRIRIWSKEVVKLPNKNDPEYPGLVNTLQRIGRIDEVKSVDTWALAKILENKEWPLEVRKELEPFMRKEKISRLYPSK